MRQQVVCPFCHEPFAVDRESCPHCGSDVDTGWRDPGGGIALGQASLPDAGEHPAASVRSLRSYRDARRRRRWLFGFAMTILTAYAIYLLIC
ncbi:MAG: hypothetical protein H6834_10370 [Planctomycetes bacterium]|nr:hypothetical protein [Planctomycetota bacterium]